LLCLKDVKISAAISYCLQTSLLDPNWIISPYGVICLAHSGEAVSQCMQNTTQDSLIVTVPTDAQFHYYVFHS